jgi:hypothetical protein
LENQAVDDRITYKIDLKKYWKVFIALIWLKIRIKVGGILLEAIMNQRVS